MIKKFINFFKGHERTVKAKKNIVASLLIKGISIIVGFLMINVALDYLDKTKYGIWITVSSFITWFSFFEIGLGDGLKNKLAESLAVKDYKLAKIYVSTTYAILAIIIGLVAILFLLLNQFIDWTIVLNTDKGLLNELGTLTLIVFSFFFLRFVLKLIEVVLKADQRPAMGSAFNTIGNLIALIVIYIFTKTTNGSLIYLGAVISIAPVLVLIFASLYFYNKDYKMIAPSLKSVDFKYSKDLFNLGFKFFLIQISTLIMFQSSNIIISQFYGPAEVTPYNIAYKLFSVIMMVFTIVISPFWSAFTEAWVIKDVRWIKKTINNFFYIWVAMVVGGIVLYFISTPLFEFWLGKEAMETIHISNVLKLALLVYFLLFTLGGIYNMFINGVGKISIQMYSLIIGALLFVPLSYVFIKYFKWGIESVVIASIISNFYSPFIAPYQYYKIINNKAHGLWNK